MHYTITKNKPTVAIVTPTVGSYYAQWAIMSVQNQTYENRIHYLVIDGRDDCNVEHKVSELQKVKSIRLPFNTGGGGFYGHRIYAAMGHLIPEDYVFFLDEDNTYEPDHIASLVDALESSPLGYGHSLRKIVNKDDEFVCNDDCESLGNWEIFNSHNQYLIDTSCYAFKTPFLRKWGHFWDSGWGGDRRFLAIMRQHQNLPLSVPKYTVRYRLDGNPGSVTADFFKQGNEIQAQKYNGRFPWTQLQELSPTTRQTM